MRIYLAVTPDKLPAALRYTGRIVHVAYRIGAAGHLERQPIPHGTRGGIMSVGDEGDSAFGDGEALCREIIEECEKFGFGSVLTDLEQSYSPQREAFLLSLDHMLHRAGRGLIVPEEYGASLEHAGVLICTAVSGGSLRCRLEEAKDRFGGRVVADLHRTRMEFPLPCPRGEGRALSAEELRCAVAEGERVFFSEELCAKYLVRPCGEELRFVLFDDAETLRRKCLLARQLGIEAGVMVFPETEDILPEIFKEKRTNV